MRGMKGRKSVNMKKRRQVMRKAATAMAVKKTMEIG